MSTRYRLQEAFKPLGPESTLLLAKSHVVVVGCGATGSHVVDTLARMGVGFLTMFDLDVVDGENLHRQLYNESDVGEFKAMCLANHVLAVNAEVKVHAIVDRITPDNIAESFALIPEASLILDCTDNIETRWLINEYAIKHNIPWIYCGVGRSKGMVQTIIPGQTACFRCLFHPDANKPVKPSGGIFPPIVPIMANVQATAAIKILTGHTDDISPMRHFDAWTCNWMNMETKPKPDCPVCGIEQSAILSGLRKDDDSDSTVD